MNWINKEDTSPTEADGQILVTNGNGFYEIVWLDDESGEYRKPMRFDEYDYVAFRDGDFKYWTHIINPE